MKRFALLAAPLVGALAAVGILAAIAWGDTSGMVSATVTAPSGGPCLTLSSPTTIDFGSGGGFSRDDSSTYLQTVDTLGPTVTNCTASPERLFAHGSNATAPSPAPTWLLINNDTGVCSSTNVYGYDLGAGDYTNSNPPVYRVVLSDRQFGIQQFGGSPDALPAQSTWDVHHRLEMPCVGSGGAGQTYSMSVVFTVTF